VSAYGVRNAYGSLKRVVMHRPGPELDQVTAATLREFNFERPVDRKRFVADYDAMLAAFRGHGVEVLLLREVLAGDEDSLGYIDLRPNMTYTRDLAAVFSRGAVLMGPHLKGRQGDQEMMGRAFRRLGVPILGRIEPPGYLEGGGVTLIGEDTAVASLCDRANQEGTRALRGLVLGKDVKYFIEVPLPFGHIHIDGIFMVLDEALCLIYEPSLSVFPCRLYEQGKTEPRHVLFRDFLDKRGFTCIPITDEERRGGHLNVVVTERSRKAVAFEQARRLREEIGRFGWQVAAFPADELFMGRGGAHCMTCPLLVS
jgi:N-dimethylarginine dimethylaminohydrolase